MSLPLTRAMVRKDLHLFLRDRRALLMSFAAPIALGTLFGFLFSQRSSAPADPRLALRVIDEDRSAASLALVAALRRDASLLVSEAAVGAPAQGAGPAFTLVLPRGFAAERDAHARPGVRVRHPAQREVSLARLRAALALAASGAAGVPFEVQAEPGPEPAATTPAFAGFAHAFAGFGVQFVLFAAVDLGLGLLQERRLGLWPRLRSAPLSRLSLLAAKAASGAVIALVILAGAFGFGMLVFGIRALGGLSSFAVMLLATALMSSAFGLLIAALGRTPQAARGAAVLAVLLMTMLGGGWVPSSSLPGWMQQAGLLLPTRWAVDGLEGVTWRGLGGTQVLAPVAVLLGFTGAFVVIAAACFRWDD